MVAHLAFDHFAGLHYLVAECPSFRLRHMWGTTLNFCLGLLTFAVTLYFIYPADVRQCTIILTGESIRLIGCDLTPEHITAVANLKVLSAPLGVQACN